MTPTPRFSKFIKNRAFFDKEFSFKIYNHFPESLLDFKVHKDIFPTTLVDVGLLFYIPEYNDTQVRNSQFLTSGGDEKVEVIIVVVVVIVIIVAPLS